MSTALLELRQITVSFDGFLALRDLNLSLQPGELRAVIGPNGAGKTTFLDVITGKTAPTEGDVVFKGRSLVGTREHRIARFGIGRKFQKPTVLENFSVFDNLELSLHADRSVKAALFARLTGEQRDRIEEVLEIIGLKTERERIAGNLSHGQKQWLEIGILLIQDPYLLLVDEPVAGMTVQETERTAELLTSLAGERSVVVVEHDMEFVRSIANIVTVLHQGSVLAEGTMNEIQEDPKVKEVYLGSTESSS